MKLWPMIEESEGPVLLFYHILFYHILFHLFHFLCDKLRMGSDDDLNVFIIRF